VPAAWSTGAEEVSHGCRRYAIPQLVADLKQIVARSADEHAILAGVRPLVRRAALSAAGWLDKRIYEVHPDVGYGVYLLHEEPDHTLAVLAVSWLPQHGIQAHDHGTWAVVAGVDGPERNVFYERIDDRSRPGYAELGKIGEKVFGVGDVIAMPAGTIPSVWNDTDALTVSLHVYDKHIDHTGRSQFDPDARTESPFIVPVMS